MEIIDQQVSQSVCLARTDRLTIYIYIYHSLNDLYRFRIYKNIRKMDSTYIKECGYKRPATQPANQPASQTDWLQPVSHSLKDRLIYIICIYIYIYIYKIVIYYLLNDLHRFRRCKNNRKVVSTYITECGYNGSQPVNLCH